MANTITTKTILATKARIILYVTLASDGTNETNTVIYDSSVQAAALVPPISDPLTSTILRVRAYASTASTARVVLRWDATTPILALSIPTGQEAIEQDFQHSIGGLPNLAKGNTGVTGDITLTTTGLASGDSIDLVLEVRPN